MRNTLKNIADLSVIKDQNSIIKMILDSIIMAILFAVVVGVFSGIDNWSAEKGFFDSLKTLGVLFILFSVCKILKKK